MNLQTLAAFFAWSTCLHFGLLFLMILLMIGFRKQFSLLHSRMFGLRPEEVNALYFRFLAIYKLGILFFGLVPYLTLRLFLL